MKSTGKIAAARRVDPRKARPEHTDERAHLPRQEADDARDQERPLRWRGADRPDPRAPRRCPAAIGESECLVQQEEGEHGAAPSGDCAGGTQHRPEDQVTEIQRNGGQ